MPLNYNLPDPNDVTIIKENIDEKDFPPAVSYSDIFSLFHDIYYGIHQIFLTIIVLVSNLFSHNKFHS